MFKETIYVEGFFPIKIEAPEEHFDKYRFTQEEESHIIDLHLYREKEILDISLERKDTSTKLSYTHKSGDDSIKVADPVFEIDYDIHILTGSYIATKSMIDYKVKVGSFLIYLLAGQGTVLAVSLVEDAIELPQSILEGTDEKQAIN